MSNPTTPIAGSIEILLPNGENKGITVEAATIDDMPVILRAVFGLTNAAAAAASPRAHAHAEWQTTTDIGDPVEVILWPTPTFDFSANGFPRDGGDGSGGTA